MMQCIFVVVPGDSDSYGQHCLQCEICGGITWSTNPPELVHVRCGCDKTNTEQILPRVRYDLGTAIDAGDWPEVSRRVEACCGCPKFSGYGCAELGKRCRTGRIRWLERLVMGECDGWAT